MPDGRATWAIFTTPSRATWRLRPDRKTVAGYRSSADLAARGTSGGDHTCFIGHAPGRVAVLRASPDWPGWPEFLVLEAADYGPECRRSPEAIFGRKPRSPAGMGETFQNYARSTHYPLGEFSTPLKLG